MYLNSIILNHYLLLCLSDSLFLLVLFHTVLQDYINVSSLLFTAFPCVGGFFFIYKSVFGNYSMLIGNTVDTGILIETIIM